MLNQFAQTFLGMTRFQSHDYSYQFSFQSTKNSFNKDCPKLSTVSLLKRVINKVRGQKADFLAEWTHREQLDGQFEAMVRRIGALSKDEILPITFFDFYLNLQH